MKKSLHEIEETHFFRVNGETYVWDFPPEELIECANKAKKGEDIGTLFETISYGNLSKWLSRFHDDGLTEKLLDDLNRALYEIQYAKYIIPQDFLSKNIGQPKSQYVAEFNKMPKPEAIAADDFSKLLTGGVLKRLKCCQLEGCGKFFLGPPQAKWCSKTCGSKYRVRNKRKRDTL